MDRRTFFGTLAGSFLAVPTLARAQQSVKSYRVGFLKRGTEPIQEPFWETMRRFGWVENQNVKVEARYAMSDDQLPTLAAELARLQVDLILTEGTPATRAAKEATSTIPVVFSVAGNPVQRGLVASMAHPGGNLTGFVYGIYQAKQLAILKEALPTISRVAYPQDGEPETEILRAGEALGVSVDGIAVKGPEDLGRFFAEARRKRADAVVVEDVAWFKPHLEALAADSIKTRMPAIGYRRVFADSGGLMSYGPPPQSWPRLAAQVDMILRGVKSPADLPIEQPTIFELVVNVKAAKSLGLTLPQSILLRADSLVAGTPAMPP